MKPRLDGTYLHRPHYLRDGDRRTMKPTKYWEAKAFKVEAHRIDCDTPYVIITVDGKEHHLADVEAHDLADRISRALAMLPTSK